MEQQSRRGLIKSAAKAAIAVTGGVALSKTAKAQVTGKLEKKSYPPKTQADRVPTTPTKAPLFSSAVVLRQSSLSRRCWGALQRHHRRTHETRAG